MKDDERRFRKSVARKAPLEEKGTVGVGFWAESGHDGVDLRLDLCALLVLVII